MKPRFSQNPIYDQSASHAANAQAGKILSRGEHWEPKLHKTPGQFREEVGIPEWRKPTPGDLDLSGQRFGKLVVKGLRPASAAPKGKSAWVVRCDCGAYEHRKAKTLRSGQNIGQMCTHCEHLEQVKAGTYPGDPVSRQRIHEAWLAKQARKQNRPPE